MPGRLFDRGPWTVHPSIRSTLRPCDALTLNCPLPSAAPGWLCCVCVCVCVVCQFIYFVDEFQLVSKEEQAPLRELIDNIYRKDAAAAGAGNSSASSHSGTAQHHTHAHTAAAAAGSGSGGRSAGGGGSHEDTLTKEQDVLAK